MAFFSFWQVSSHIISVDSFSHLILAATLSFSSGKDFWLSQQIIFGVIYKMETIPKEVMLCFIAIGLIVFSGCAVIQSLGGAGAESVNYALASNGATVAASNYTSGHEPSTAINGITSSEGWDDGEGWECSFTRNRPREGGWSRLDPRKTMDFGSAWLEVQFDGTKLLNKVTIHTLDSHQYPAIYHGIQEAWMQLWMEYGWTSVGEIKNGNIVSRDNLSRQPAGGKMVFKFDPVETDKMRFVVFRSNDFKTVGQGWRNDRKSERSTARVVEIEATGIGSGTSDVVRVNQAPEFSLQNMDGEWVRLSTFRGKVVIVTFWAVWSSGAKRQVRDLSSLHSKFADQDVVIIGISVNEGGAERIRPFVNDNNLTYPILIAKTSTKTDYGGIGKLPTTFVIDQKGNIYKEYFAYQSRQILELDIKSLLPRN